MGQSRRAPRALRDDVRPVVKDSLSSLQRVVASSKTICAWRRSLPCLVWGIVCPVSSLVGYMRAPNVCVLGGHGSGGPQTYQLRRGPCASLSRRVAQQGLVGRSTSQSCLIGHGRTARLAGFLGRTWSVLLPRRDARWDQSVRPPRRVARRDLVGLDGSLRVMGLL